MKRLLTLSTFLLTMVISVFAYDFEKGGFYYVITSQGSTPTVSLCNRGGSGNEYYGDIVIPETVEYNDITYSVTGIEDNAFYICYRINSIIIPNSITYIGSSAFYGCIYEA